MPRPAQGKRQPSSTNQTPSAKRRKKAVTKLVKGNTNAEPLFEMVKAGSTALESVCSDWVERYQEDAGAATSEVVQFLFNASGCNVQMDSENFEELDVATVTAEFSNQENFPEDGSYPLSADGSKCKSYLVEFIKHLIGQTLNSVLHDGYFIETVVQWLIQLSSSAVRQLRHTATFIVLKLNTSLIEVANHLREEGDITMRQLEGEKKKSPTKRASAKLELLKKSLTESQTKLHGIELQMNAISTGVFSERYRDVVDDVRARCIEELGVWIKEYQVVYLSDQFLKYIGWLLHDKCAEVRLMCVKALKELFCPSLVYHLSMFTTKFKERLLKMKSDVNESVAVETIQLLEQMLELELIENEEAEDISKLVFGSIRPLARAAGQFLCTFYFTEDLLSPSFKGTLPKGKRRPTENEVKLKSLARYFLDANIHEHGVHFVDSLWNSTEAIKDWEAMLSLLKAIPETSMVTLENQEETAVIEFMYSAAQKAAGTLHQVLGDKKKVMSRRDREVMETDKQTFTQCLMEDITEILVKYDSDPQKAACLVTLPQYFDLSMYNEARAEQLFEGLTDQLRVATLKCVEPEILQELSKTYKYFCTESWTYQQTAERKVQAVMNEMADHLSQVTKRCEDFNDLDEDLTFNLEASLCRIAEFSKSFNMLHLNFITKLTPLLRVALKGSISDEAICAVFRILLNQFWFAVVEHSKKKDPSEDDLKELRHQFLQFVKCSEAILRDQNVSLFVKEAVVTVLSDALIVYGPQLKKTKPKVAILSVSPSEVLQVAMRDVVYQIVCSADSVETANESWEDPEKIAKILLSRRKVLTGFLKLVMYRNVEMIHACPIFAQYVKGFADYGDIIKSVLTHCLRYNIANKLYEWSHVVVQTLKSEFELLQEEGGQLSYGSEAYMSLKDLAKKFSLLLGTDSVKARYQVVAIHRFGIKYSFSKEEEMCPNLAFLEFLAEFSQKLLDVDKTGENGVLAYLEANLPKELADKKSVKMYKESLGKRKGKA